MRWTVCVNWMCVFAFGPKAGAQCVSSARWDLCGGPPARAVPTAIRRVPILPLDEVARGRFPDGRHRAGRSTDVGALADWLVVAGKLLLDAVGVEPRGRVIRGCVCSINRDRGFGRSLDGRAEVVRQVVRYFEVGGAGGLGEGEGESRVRRGGRGDCIEEFEKDLKNNLYKVWSASSRAGGVAMSSG